MIIMTVGCLLLVFFPLPEICLSTHVFCYQRYINLLLATVVKFGITIFKSILITYTTEVYPTTVRSLGFGWNMTVGRFGIILF